MPSDLDLKTLIGIFVQLTLFLLMLSVGLSTGVSKILVLARNPSLLIRAVLAAFVLVPLAAMLINWAIPMSFPMRLGLAMMAICPGAPMIYRKSLKGRALPDVAASYQVTMSLLAVVLVPVWLVVLSRMYQEGGAVAPAAVFKQVAMGQLLPIALGLAARQWCAGLAGKLAGPVTKVGNVLLIGVLVLIVVAVLPKALSVGGPAILGAILFGVSCLFIGHLLGGPEPAGRLTIAVSNGSRNGGLALAIAGANFKDPGIVAAIAAIALFSALAGVVYTRIYEKRMGGPTDTGAEAGGRLRSGPDASQV